MKNWGINDSLWGDLKGRLEINFLNLFSVVPPYKRKRNLNRYIIIITYYQKAIYLVFSPDFDDALCSYYVQK